MRARVAHRHPRPARARAAEDDATKFVAILLENTALALNLMCDLEEATHAVLEVEGHRFDQGDVRALYESPQYPLKRKSG